tara:strand:- start:6436 stop:6813 length:378 start_codon:yes stop_codon:yes gene_type:complete
MSDKDTDLLEEAYDRISQTKSPVDEILHSIVAIGDKYQYEDVDGSDEDIQQAMGLVKDAISEYLKLSDHNPRKKKYYQLMRVYNSIVSNTSDPTTNSWNQDVYGSDGPWSGYGNPWHHAREALGL